MVPDALKILKNACTLNISLYIHRLAKKNAAFENLLILTPSLPWNNICMNQSLWYEQRGIFGFKLLLKIKPILLVSFYFNYSDPSPETGSCHELKKTFSQSNTIKTKILMYIKLFCDLFLVSMILFNNVW